MLSRKDIEKELGKGINIYPLHLKNIKENSVNFTLGKNAWTLGNGRIKKSNGKYIIVNGNEQGGKIIELSKGKSAIISERDSNYVVLLPHSTTVVETSEVIAVDNRIGGTLHSKVGIVAQGIGDIGTMLGPYFCGHLMISLHNVTDNLVMLKVGDTFVSLVFYYLATPSTATKNSNISGHVDKLSELGIQIGKATREYLTEDWKQDLIGIRNKMTESDSFKAFKEEQYRNRKNIFQVYFNKRNILLVLAYIIVFILLYVLACWRDGVNGTDIWVDKYLDILVTGIIVPIVVWGIKFVRKND